MMPYYVWNNFFKEENNMDKELKLCPLCKNNAEYIGEEGFVHCTNPNCYFFSIAIYDDKWNNHLEE